jgi:Ca2+:H+ antiporter
VTKPSSSLPFLSIAAPVVSWIALTGAWAGLHGAFLWVLVAGLIAGVLAAVHHAEVVAHQVGEPFGSLVLALAVTLIEVAIIVSLMISGGPATAALARDSVFAAVMIIVNGILGLCLLVGAWRFREQSFGLQGVTATLATLAAISVLTLVLPNYTVTTPGPYYSQNQLAFVAVVSLVLYGTYVFVQAVRHRDHFLPQDSAENEQVHAFPPGIKTALLSAGLLMACLSAVVLLAKKLAPALEAWVQSVGAPSSVVGTSIAAIVLLPEGLAALRAARANRLQTSLNLALGSALASIGLTIPAVAIVSIMTGWTLTLGISGASTVLLILSLVVATLSLGTGRTNVLHGAIHLVLFAVYLFLTVVP